MEQDKLQLFIANRIKYLRLKKGISQEKLSELAGLGSKHIHNIEHRKYNFQIQTLSKIIDALGVDRETFFDFEATHYDYETEKLLNLISKIPIEQRSDIIAAINTLLLNNKNNRQD